MNIVDDLRAALTTAMKARDKEAVSVLRTVLAAIANAEAQVAPEVDLSTGSGPIAGAASGVGASDVARRELSDGEIVGILEAERAERLAAGLDVVLLDRLIGQAGGAGTGS